MKRTYGGWAVSSLRTTMRIERISDLIRTLHRRDRSRGNRRGRNWNRWHGSAAYIIDTAGEQPREHAVKFTGRAAESTTTGVFLGLVRGRHTAFVLLWDQSKATGETISETRLPCLDHVKLTLGLGPTEFWRTTGFLFESRQRHLTTDNAEPSES